MVSSAVKPKCVNCGKKVTHAIVDFSKRYVWCAPCWKEYLADYRSANPDTDPPQKAA